MEGRLQEAERLNDEARALVERAQEPLLAQAHQFLGLAVRREQLGWREMEADLKREAEDYPTIWWPVYLVCLCETGQETEARDKFEDVAASDFADLPRDGAWFAVMALLSQACALLTDAARAAGMDNKNFSEKMKRYGVTLESFK